MSKKNQLIFWRLMKAQTINYVTDPVNIILGIVLTSVTMLCWIAFRPVDPSTGLSSDSFVLASAIGITCIRNSQYNLNLTLSDWRDTRFTRNLLTTPISKKLLFISILIFNWMVNIIVSLLLMIMAICFSSQRLAIAQVEWGPFIIGFVFNILLSNAIALFLSVWFKNRDYLLITSVLSYFIPMYLLGLAIPWKVVGQIKEINIIMYLAPHRYALHLMQAAWVGTSSNMAFPDVQPETWLGTHGFGYNKEGWSLPALISFGFIVLFFTMFILKLNNNYKFGNRKYANYKNITVNLKRIDMIKKTTSVAELKQYIELSKIPDENIKVKRKVKKHAK